MGLTVVLIICRCWSHILGCWSLSPYGVGLYTALIGPDAVLLHACYHFSSLILPPHCNWGPLSHIPFVKSCRHYSSWFQWRIAVSLVLFSRCGILFPEAVTWELIAVLPGLRLNVWFSGNFVWFCCFSDPYVKDFVSIFHHSFSPILSIASVSKMYASSKRFICLVSSSMHTNSPHLYAIFLKFVVDHPCGQMPRNLIHSFLDAPVFSTDHFSV